MKQAHCAKFSDALLPEALHLLTDVARLRERSVVVDPFAGSGKGVDYLAERGFFAVGVELEPEWAGASPLVIQGNALSLPWKAKTVDAIFTSPTYGNRMADVDMRDSVSGTYAKSLGRRATEGSSCHLQWGSSYRVFHELAWREAKRVLCDYGWFVLNVKDHVRNKEVQRVSDWHLDALQAIGFSLIESSFIATPGHRVGANSEARVDGEWLHLLQLHGAQ